MLDAPAELKNCFTGKGDFNASACETDIDRPPLAGQLWMMEAKSAVRAKSPVKHAMLSRKDVAPIRASDIP